MTPLLNQEEILEIIPHRDPFVFINEVLELSETRIVGRYYCSEDKDFFRGHFPREKVMPGVLQLEALAQTGAVLALSRPEFKGHVVYFGGMEKVRFRRKVLPGEVLTIKVYLQAMRSRVGFAAGEVYVGDELCCQAKISFVVSEAPM
jgi:3-hydroxyacyl-[acyl-carrier-protein] dehydratase